MTTSEASARQFLMKLDSYLQIFLLAFGLGIFFSNESALAQPRDGGNVTYYCEDFTLSLKPVQSQIPVSSDMSFFGSVPEGWLVITSAGISVPYGGRANFGSTAVLFQRSISTPDKPIQFTVIGSLNVVSEVGTQGSLRTFLLQDDLGDSKPDRFLILVQPSGFRKFCEYRQ